LPGAGSGASHGLGGLDVEADATDRVVGDFENRELDAVAPEGRAGLGEPAQSVKGKAPDRQEVAIGG